LEYDPFANTLHCSRDVVFRDGKRYTVPNAAVEAISIEPFYKDVIEELNPTSTTKDAETSQPTRD
jgi:hypothetical protein